MELADTSIWARKANPSIKAWLDTALVQAQVAICDQIALEVLAGATSHSLYRQARDDLRGLFWLPMDARDWERSFEVYDRLEERGTNTRRSVKIPDLLIAACAERNLMTIAHYDRDFDTIASVTGQATRWIAPRGSLH